MLEQMGKTQFYSLKTDTPFEQLLNLRFWIKLGNLKI